MKRALEGLHVLVVEDNEDMRELIRTALSSAGAKVDESEDGIAGCERAMSSGPDVVIMDTCLPRLDGNAATVELRRRGFREPIVALTANAMSWQKDQSIAAGVDAFLTKPFECRSLIRTVAAYAKGRPVPRIDRPGT